jgi:hypothetical protein
VTTTVRSDPVVASAFVDADSAASTLTVWPTEFGSAAGRMWADFSYASPLWGYLGRRRVAPAGFRTA